MFVSIDNLGKNLEETKFFVPANPDPAMFNDFVSIIPIYF